MRREPDNFGTWGSLCEIVDAVACYSGDVEPFHEVGGTGFSIAIDNVVDCSFVVSFEHIHVEHVLVDKHFFGNFNDFVATVLVENNDVVDAGACTQVFIFFQGCADKAFFAVDVEFFVSFRNVGGFDVVEVAYNSAPGPFVSVFVLKALILSNGIVCEVCEMIARFGNFFVKRKHFLFRLVGVEFKDARHFDFKQAQQVVECYGAYELRFERFEAAVDVFGCFLF